MPVVLARIDDRLIHGQVTVGWSERLRPDRILLANNAIAADTWQTRVYSSTVPPHIQVSILPVAKAAASSTRRLACRRFAATAASRGMSRCARR